MQCFMTEDGGPLIVILIWSDGKAKDPPDNACHKNQVFPQARLRGSDASMDPSLTLRMPGLPKNDFLLINRFTTYIPQSPSTFVIQGGSRSD